jgi:hypothetical protein
MKEAATIKHIPAANRHLHRNLSIKMGLLRPVLAPAGTVLVATKNVLVATKTLPVATATFPVAIATLPVATRTFPVATKILPVATKPVVLATGKVSVARKMKSIATKNLSPVPQKRVGNNGEKDLTEFFANLPGQAVWKAGFMILRKKKIE